MKQILKQLLPENIKKEYLDIRRRKNCLKHYDPNQIQNPIYQTSIAVLDYYRCIFIHIPKNAGLSVCYSLFGNTGGSHRKVMDYKELFSKRTFNNYYKFTFVRNPWDRLVSTYFFLKTGGLTEQDAAWTSDHLGHYEDFGSFVKEWVTEENISNSLHFQHQHIFLENEQGNIEVDFIGRFENLEVDFKVITKKLGINRNLMRTNTSNRDKDYRGYYDNETKAIVSKVYEKDIFRFNYEF